MRTEANKMHKSIPLRKQETHSASLMTDLGLSGQRGCFFYFDCPNWRFSEGNTDIVAFLLVVVFVLF